ncbi:POK6 protein, partial [Corythaixoides concolor]|nr:POK6 protein [Corythaixoides concolor]
SKGRTMAVRRFGIEPDEIWMPYRRQQWDTHLATADSVALALCNFYGEIVPGPTLSLWQHTKVINPTTFTRVLETPKPGSTYFIDTLSKTQTAVVVWQEKDKWRKCSWTQAHKSVQYLEAKAVSEAVKMEPTQHINIVTDSFFVFKLIHKMTSPGWAGTEIAQLLEDALQQRAATCMVVHVNSHSSYPGFYQQGNIKVDKAANFVWTLVKAKELHEFLHIGAKALTRNCNIPLAQAKEVVSTCPYCQHTPLWGAGVNPRGTKPNQIWQTDFTQCPLLKPQQWLAVTVDTSSGLILATQHKKQTARSIQQHWGKAIAWLGVPQQIKTDNGPCFIAASTADWASKWGITLMHGILYNSTGQAIVERANQTLKRKLQVLGQGEGFTTTIPVPMQAQLLTRALYALNHFARGDDHKSPAEWHWVWQVIEDGPPVKVRFPGTTEWQKEWRLVIQGR